jgi:hypothetical protein
MEHNSSQLMPLYLLLFLQLFLGFVFHTKKVFFGKFFFSFFSETFFCPVLISNICFLDDKFP